MILSPASWLLRPTTPPKTSAARLRLFCFSYAGGSASAFLPWQAGLNPAIDVCAIQMPGRGARLNEAPLRSLPALIEALAHIVPRHDDLPFTFFGHSLGSLVAFELARHCRRHRLALPEHLFVSGGNAPQCRAMPRRLHELDDDALITALKDYNGTPAAVLEHRELMELMLPTIRADFALAADYEYHLAPPLDIPITVLAGKHDRHVQLDRLEHWRQETTQACELLWFEGDHFFIHSKQQAVLACLNRTLAGLTCAQI